MKKFLLLSIFMALLLGACSNNSIELELNENDMILSIENNANFEFYSLEVSTSGITSGVANADGSKIKKGDTLSVGYIDGVDLNLEGEATFEFVLIGEEGDRIPLKEITLELTTNKEYLFKIVGDSINEADLIIGT